MTHILFQNNHEVHELYLKFLGKTQKSLDNDINLIVEWIKTQPHLPEIPSRNAISYFLKANKCSIELTKKHIDMYYTVRHLLPEVFENSHPRESEMQEIARTCYQIILPKLTAEGNVVTVIKIQTPYTSTKEYFRSITHIFNLIEVRLAEDVSVRDILVFDLENHTMSQLLKMTPTVLKVLQVCLKHIFSPRIEKIIILNSPISEKLVNLLKTFISKKLAERIVVLDNYEKLFEHVPKQILPSNYGGDELSMDELYAIWQAKLEEYYPRFDELAKMRVKEELRPTPLNNDEILGYYGNFKKLEVD